MPRKRMPALNRAAGSGSLARVRFPGKAVRYPPSSYALMVWPFPPTWVRLSTEDQLPESIGLMEIVA